VLAACLFREPRPNDKVIKNPCSFLCSDPELVPPVDHGHLQGAVKPGLGILTLHYSERKAERAAMTQRGRKRKAVPAEAPGQAAATEPEGEEEARLELQRRGSVAALRRTAEHFGA
jgi:hypothetical protein